MKNIDKIKYVVFIIFILIAMTKAEEKIELSYFDL